MTVVPAADGVPMGKVARQQAIREILEARTIASQEDLKRELDRRGQRVTQATLSRDLRELGVSRVARDGRFAYVIASDGDRPDLRPIVGAEVIGIDANEVLIVVHTIPGAAHTVGEYVDRQRNPDIIGTVAGDNTLLVIPAAAARTAAALASLRRLLGRG